MSGLVAAVPAEVSSARRREVRRVVLGAVAIVAVVVALVAGYLVFGRRSPSGLTATRTWLTQDSRFTSGPTAGQTFAKISATLLTDGKACEHDHPGRDPRCVARLSGAAWANVTAVNLLNCTAPGVFQARTRLSRYLAAVDALDQSPRHGRVPPVPTVPECS